MVEPSHRRQHPRGYTFGEDPARAALRPVIDEPFRSPMINDREHTWQRSASPHNHATNSAGCRASTAPRRAGARGAFYGDGEEPRHISLDDHALSQALKQTKVILEIDIDGDVIPTAPRDIQRHPVRHDSSTST